MPREPRRAVAWLTLAGAALTFLATLYAVRTGVAAARWDGPLAQLVARHRTTWLTETMRVVTWAGSGLVVTVVVAATGVAARRRGGSWRPMLWLAGLAVALAVVDAAAKAMVGRPRPPVAGMLAHASGSAFPSGHSMQAVTYLAVAWLLAAAPFARGGGSPTRSRPARLRLVWSRLAWLRLVWPRLVWPAAVAVVAAVGTSRVYLGVHWGSDVVGGWSAGVACLAVAVLTRGPATADPDREPAGRSPAAGSGPAAG